MNKVPYRKYCIRLERYLLHTYKQKPNIVALFFTNQKEYIMEMWERDVPAFEVAKIIDGILKTRQE